VEYIISSKLKKGMGMDIKLSTEQNKAVTHISGPLCILGAAGTGKTVVLAHKIAYLIKEKMVQADSILIFGSKSSASNSLRSIVKEIVGSEVENLFFATLYSFCAEVLRDDGHLISLRKDFTIYTPPEQLRLLISVCSKKEKEDSYNVLSYIRQFKNNIKTFEGDKKEEKLFLGIMKKYQKKLKQYNSIDKDDLVCLCLELFKKKPEILQKYQELYPYILVDEYENCSALQHELYTLLASKYKKLCIAGDPYQSIGRNKGNTPIYLEQFNKDYPKGKTIDLKKNFRSTQALTQEALCLFEECKYKTIDNNLSKGEQPFTYYLAFDEKDEANYITEEIDFLRKQESLEYKDMLVFFRTHSQRSVLEKAFNENGIPYRFSETEAILIQSEVQFIIYYLRLVLNPYDNESFFKIASYSYNKYKTCSIVKLKSHVDKEGCSVFDLFKKDPNLIPKICRPHVTALFSLASNLREEYLESDDPDKLAHLIQKLATDTGLMQLLEKENTLESLEREENIIELCSYIKEHRYTLSSFLDYIAVTTKLNDMSKPAPPNAVTLITLSNAKGLEAEAIFITGVEEGLMPHYKSIFDPDAIEEEKRLFYIGLMRAKKFIYLTVANRRTLFGDTWYDEISRFLKLLPKTAIAGFVSNELADNTDVIAEKIEEVCPHYQVRKSNGKKEAAYHHIKFKVGNKVLHNMWGKGIIKKIDGKEDRAVLSINFKNGNKQLMAKFAPLEIIE
jgi:DNA helicase II / ATP-dependent DNA helicase PcrA